jgi:hypothetical protein
MGTKKKYIKLVMALEEKTKDVKLKSISTTIRGQKKQPRSVK